MIFEKKIKIPKGDKTHKISMFFQDQGKDLLILLHGLGGSKADFSSLADSHHFKNISLLGMDFLGFGNSDKPDDFSYTMEDQAMICTEILKDYKDYHWHLVCHSMGGAIGLMLPDNILKKVVSFANLEGNLIDKDCFLSRKVIDRGFDGFVKELLPKMKARLADAPLLLSDLNRASSRAYYQSCKSLVKWSDNGRLLEKFKSLPLPKAYFFGERNAGIEPLKRLKGIEQILIEQSGHMMMMDNPEDFCAKLKHFLPLKNN